MIQTIEKIKTGEVDQDHVRLLEAVLDELEAASAGDLHPNRRKTAGGIVPVILGTEKWTIDCVIRKENAQHRLMKHRNLRGKLKTNNVKKNVIGRKVTPHDKKTKIYTIFKAINSVQMNEGVRPHLKTNRTI